MNQINEKRRDFNVYLRRNSRVHRVGPRFWRTKWNCVSARLRQAGCACASSASADGEDADSITFFYRLVYQDTDRNQIINKMQHACLKLVSIVQKCKFKIPATAANNVIAETRLTRHLSTEKAATLNDWLKKSFHQSVNQMGGCGKGRLGK